jgi:hypothetical protein
MVKAFMIASLIVAGLVASRPVVADPIEVEDYDQEYDLGFGIGDGEIYDQIWDQGIDLANQVQKPPVVECVLMCSQAESEAMFACALIPHPVARGACIAAVTGGGMVCKWYCTTR